MPSGLIEQQDGMGTRCDMEGDLIEMLAHCLAVATGHDDARGLALGRQIAPKIQADARRWSLGADGRVPRLAQRRVSLVCWPIRASSCHHSSIGVPLGSAFLIFARRAANVF
jgi:hypothetical protein